MTSLAQTIAGERDFTGVRLLHDAEQVFFHMRHALALAPQRHSSKQHKLHPRPGLSCQMESALRTHMLHVSSKSLMHHMPTSAARQSRDYVAQGRGRKQTR
eukprot:5836970-Amphidinium_carterae.1